MDVEPATLGREYIFFYNDNENIKNVYSIYGKTLDDSESAADLCVMNGPVYM